MPSEDTQFKKGDPRAAAAGRKGKPSSRKTREEEALDRLMRMKIEIPEGVDPPSALELQRMARAVTPACFAFASGVLEDKKAELPAKFQAANLLLKHSAAAVESEEVNRLRAILDSLRSEHRSTVAEMKAEHAKALADMKARAEDAEAELAKLKQIRSVA